MNLISTVSSSRNSSTDDDDDDDVEMFLSSDGSRECGIAGICAFYYALVRFIEYHKQTGGVCRGVPPVLLSTVSALGCLYTMQRTCSKKFTADFVAYFDNAVTFLGDWMSLFLLPSLVLLPNALTKIKGGVNSRLLVKYVGIQFILWSFSITSTAFLYRLLDNGGIGSSTSSASRISIDNHVQTQPQQQQPQSQQPQQEAELEVKRRKEQQQRKLITFWGVVLIFFYSRIKSCTTPALMSTR